MDIKDYIINFIIIWIPSIIIFFIIYKIIRKKSEKLEIINEKKININEKNNFIDFILFLMKIFCSISFIIFFIILLLIIIIISNKYTSFFESEECKKIKREIEYMNDYFWKELTEKNFIAQEMKNYYCK